MLVRALRTLQDQVALGSSDARETRGALLRETGEKLLKMKQEVWRNPANVRAAVAFVLNGGNPRVLKNVQAAGPLPEVDELLVRGALAYGEGHTAEAAKLLGGLDARTLAPSLGGNVALVQAELIGRREPAKALALLDEARLLAPGTLTEEAALRRQIAIVAATADFGRFTRLSASYMHRFANSAYAGAFQHQFAVDFVKNAGAVTSGSALAPRLQTVLDEVPSDRRGELYLAIAREALIKGKIDLTRVASRAAAEAGEDASQDRGRRATLYEAAAAVATGDVDQAVPRLEAMAGAALPAEDAELLRAALAVAQQVRRLPPNEGEVASADPAPEIVEAARKALARVDQLMAEAGK
jgi:chemotaxis protein MotC